MTNQTRNQTICSQCNSEHLFSQEYDHEFIVIRYPSWEIIESDITVAQYTGIWPDGKIPEWVSDIIRSYPRSTVHASSLVVTNLGLREIIRQLKTEAKP